MLLNRSNSVLGIMDVLKAGICQESNMITEGLISDADPGLQFVWDNQAEIPLTG